MKDKKVLFISIIIVIALLGLIEQFVVMSNSKKNQKGSETDKSVSLPNTNTKVQDEKDYSNRISPQDINFVDEETYKIIKEVYSKIDFWGKFEKGDEEVYDFYKEQYLRLL